MTDQVHNSKFSLREQVWIDKVGAIEAVVTCVQFRTHLEPLYQVSYFHNGHQQEPFVEEWRLFTMEEK